MAKDSLKDLKVPSGAHKRGAKVSELAAASAALEAELARYEEHAAEALRVPLTSEKNLARAARAMTEAADAQERVGDQVRAMVQAINVAREKQEATAQRLSARAQEVKGKADELHELTERFAGLGTEAKEINALMHEAAAIRNGEGGKTQAKVVVVVERLHVIHERMESVVGRAQDLSTSATAQGMVEVARQADALRQQVIAAKNKLTLLQKSLAAGDS